jgi:hypothetical protein
MTCDELIETVTEMVINEKVKKNGLTLYYTLDEQTHYNLNKEIFYKNNPQYLQFDPTDEFEVVIYGILVKVSKVKEE